MLKTLDILKTRMNDYQTSCDCYATIYCPVCNDSMDSMFSLNITISTGNFHCFGCGACGDLIFLIARLNWIPLAKAITKARQLHAEVTHGRA